MQHVYLSRRNLLTLLSKLDRAKAGEATQKTLVKRDTTHSKYPCTDIIEVTAVEDEEYYNDRLPGVVHPADTPKPACGLINHEPGDGCADCREARA